VCPDSDLHDGLALAQAVESLIDFGGGGLRLKSGHMFRLVRACDACGNASRAFNPRSGLEFRFCYRCQNDLAEAEWKRREHRPENPD
jgi:hypothetical protein